MCARQSVCHTKRVERCTGRNRPPIFTKLAIMVVCSRRRDHLLSLVEIRNTSVRKTGSGINFYHCSYGKMCLMSNILKMVRDTKLESKEVKQETTYGLSMNFDLDDLEPS